MISMSEIVEKTTKERLERPGDRVSDWYLPEGKAIENGHFWPGGLAIRDHDHLYAMASVLAKRAALLADDGHEDFVIQEGNRSYHGHILRTLYGRVFALRCLPINTHAATGH